MSPMAYQERIFLYDLFMEHLNRVVKDAVNGLGANKTPKALVRVGKVVGTLDKVLRKFDEDNNVAERASRHKVASFKEGVDHSSTSLT